MKQWIVYVVATAVVVVVWLAAVMYPIERDRAEFLHRSGTAERQLIDFQTTVQQLPVFIESQRRMEALKNALHSRLYSKEEILELFDRIRVSANEHGLKVVEISPPVEELLALNRQAPQDGRPQFLNLQLTLAGDYIAFGKFVASIEDAPYFRGINGCMINYFEDKDGITANLGFRALLSGSGDDA